MAHTDAYKDKIVWKFENEEDRWITKLTAKIKASNMNNSPESYYTRVALLGKIGSIFYIICQHYLSGTPTLKYLYRNGDNEQEERWDRPLVAFDEIQVVLSTVQYTGWGASYYYVDVLAEYSIEGNFIR